jgi:hypothetical protein
MAHDQEIMSSNPGTLYWMDVSDASYYIIEKLKIKFAKWGTPKKYFKNRVVVRISISLFIVRLHQYGRYWPLLPH